MTTLRKAACVLALFALAGCAATTQDSAAAPGLDCSQFHGPQAANCQNMQGN